jgi:hypothetical protein
VVVAFAATRRTIRKPFCTLFVYANLHKSCGKPVDFTPFSCQTSVYLRCHHHIA